MGRNQQGFSLLEISIVIALIGLIAGVVMIGQGFVRRHELRSVIYEANTYAIAIQQFKLKYQAMPGDMRYAIEVWGKADGSADTSKNCNNPTTDISVGKTTCNGDGDGIIEPVGCEDYRAWQQMAAGEFITGKFSGVSGLAACAPNSIPEINSPVAALGNTTFTITSYGQIAGHSVLFDGNFDNILMFGSIRANDYAVNPALKVEAAKEVDLKVDDGSPAFGSVRSVKPASTVTPNCTTTSSDYNETYRDTACMLIFTSSYMRPLEQ